MRGAVPPPGVAGGPRTAVLRTVDGVAVNEWHVESPSGNEPEQVRLARGLTRLAGGDRGPLGLLDRRRQFSARPSGTSTIGTPAALNLSSHDLVPAMNTGSAFTKATLASTAACA